MRKLQGDAEALPFETDRFDRYVSAGSIEYWPAPERGIAEAYRVLKPGGVALVAGPVPPGDRVLRWLAELWMLFPTEAQYREWFERAGFEDVVGHRGGARLVPRPALAVRGRRERAQAGGGGVAARAAPARVEDVRGADGLAAAARVRRALRARLAGGLRVRAGRRRAGAAAAAMTGRAVALPAARPLGALWRFSRPHTIIGTTVSIVALYLIAVDTLPGLAFDGGLFDLFWTLVAGLAVNVYIVGINQLEDVEIDRVNKPFLPLAAGEMTMETGRAIVATTAALAVVLAITQGAVETVAVVVGLAVGTAYSLPPLRLKRFAVAASLCISGVRSVVVNLGVYAHFSLALGPDGTVSIPAAVWALTIVVLPFSFAIAILKDVPDAEGDRRFRIMTFTVRVGGAKVLRAGLAVLALAYVGMAVLGPPLIPRGAAVGAGGRPPGGAGAAAGLGRGARTRTTRRSSRASTCACGSCSSSSTRSSRSPAWRASARTARRHEHTAIRAAIAPASAIGIAVRSFEPSRLLDLVAGSRPRAGAPPACAGAGGRAWRR